MIYILSVLVLAGIESIFFIVAGMELCLGFVLEALIFYYCWAILAQSQGPFCLSAHSTNEESGTQQTWGDIEGQPNPTDPRDIPPHMWWSCAFWGWLNTCLPVWNCGLIPCFALLPCTVCAFLLNLLSQPMSFQNFLILEVDSLSLEKFKNVWIWHLGMWFNGEHGRGGWWLNSMTLTILLFYDSCPHFPRNFCGCVCVSPCVSDELCGV